MLYPLHFRFIADVPFRFSPQNSSSSSTTSSEDSALAEHRVERFMSDETTTTAILALQSNRNVSAEAVKFVAKDRIAAKLLEFDNVFGQPTAGAS
jgi:hypothetical protein